MAGRSRSVVPAADGRGLWGCVIGGSIVLVAGHQAGLCASALLPMRRVTWADLPVAPGRCLWSGRGPQATAPAPTHRPPGPPPRAPGTRRLVAPQATPPGHSLRGRQAPAFCRGTACFSGVPAPCCASYFFRRVAPGCFSPIYSGTGGVAYRSESRVAGDGFPVTCRASREGGSGDMPVRFRWPCAAPRPGAFDGAGCDGLGAVVRGVPGPWGGVGVGMVTALASLTPRLGTGRQGPREACPGRPVSVPVVLRLATAAGAAARVSAGPGGDASSGDLRHIICESAVCCHLGIS